MDRLGWSCTKKWWCEGMHEKAQRIGIVWSCLFHIFEEVIWDSARG
ncbi:hypothetical protein [Bartonella kosoyi]|nr:hypothetical protein [Bartonella kosoyi]